MWKAVCGRRHLATDSTGSICLLPRGHGDHCEVSRELTPDEVRDLERLRLRMAAGERAEHDPGDEDRGG